MLLTQDCRGSQCGVQPLHHSSCIICDVVGTSGCQGQCRHGRNDKWPAVLNGNGENGRDVDCRELSGQTLCLVGTVRVIPLQRP